MPGLPSSLLQDGHYWLVMLYPRCNDFLQSSIGLLGALKSIQKHTHLRQFAGQTIGVDAYGWLHRGTVACAMELALDMPCKKFVAYLTFRLALLTDSRYVEFAMHRVRMLIYFGVTPYLVFDGDNLPSKAGTEIGRAQKREESKRRGLELYKASKVSQAYPEFQKSVDVTPYMARKLIEELKKMNIQYVVAPYEADAQLAYLEKKGMIDAILSEDSDLLVYGAKRLITKLDQHGDCIEISRADFASCRDITLAGFTDADFRLMTILSGCDYLPSINKVGLKTAHTYVRKYKHVEKILRMLQFEQKFIVPDQYLERFKEAERTFLHHRVFCPLEKKLVFLSELKDGVKETDMPYLGGNVIPAIAVGVACGDLDPMTKEVIPGAPLSRSIPGLQRRKTVASADDLKSSKSLDNFFKPKRQPLAELDPNSLTPSPSQQRLLERHRNASWEARHVSSAPQLSRSTSGLLDPEQPARAQSKERSSFLERAATLSTFQPAKRTRLCSDLDTSPSGKDGRSPFFAAQPEPSPSIRKAGKTKKARLSEIEIFSDDSVADIFQEMEESKIGPVDSFIVPLSHPDDAITTSNRKAVSASKQVTEVVESPIHQAVRIPQSTISDNTPTISISVGDDAEEFQDLVGLHVKQLNNLRNTFAYQPPGRQAAALRALSPPNDTTLNASQVELKSEKLPAQNLSLEYNRGSAAHSSSRITASLSKTFGTQSSHQKVAALKSLGQTQNPARKLELGLAALQSAAQLDILQRPSTPLQQLGHRALQRSRIASYTRGALAPAVSRLTDGVITSESTLWTDEVSQMNIQGSEDLLVPKSEDEASEVSEVDDVKPMRQGLDLTRFLFSTNA